MVEEVLCGNSLGDSRGSLNIGSTEVLHESDEYVEIQRWCGSKRNVADWSVVVKEEERAGHSPRIVLVKRSNTQRSRDNRVLVTGGRSQTTDAAHEILRRDFRTMLSCAAN